MINLPGYQRLDLWTKHKSRLLDGRSLYSSYGTQHDPTQVTLKKSHPCCQNRIPIQIRKPQWIRLGLFELGIAFDPLTTRPIHVVINKKNFLGRLELASQRLHVLELSDDFFASCTHTERRFKVAWKSGWTSIQEPWGCSRHQKHPSEAAIIKWSSGCSGRPQVHIG